MTSDRELMARIADRDEAAFETLRQRHAGAVRAALARIVRDRHAVDDLLQETFLRVWAEADRWLGQGAVAGWLHRIATNLALNHLRTRRRRPQVAFETAAEPEEPDVPPAWLVEVSSLGPEAIVEAAEERRWLADRIGELPETKQEVLRLLCELDLDIRAVAERLGVPPGTVKSRLHYATRALAARRETDWED